MFFEFLLRILICFLLSVIIGIERQYRHKMVGLRTNVLVSLGAFMFNWVSYSSFNSDITRIAAQVVSGIGFLGAGIIMKVGNNIKGLNTAATLWCVAAIGLLTSSGLLIEASVGTFMVLVSNIILRYLSILMMNKIQNNNKEIYVIKIKIKKGKENVIREEIFKFVDENSINLINVNKGRNKQFIILKVVIITSRRNLIESFVNKLFLNLYVYDLCWKHIKNDDNIDEYE